MVKVENILWLTDFSEDSEHALAYARTLAELFETRLFLLHVIDNPTSNIYGRVEGDYLAMEANARDKSREKLRASVDQGLQNFANYEELIREGDVLTRILDVVTEKQIGTIVMGTQGRAGLAHLLLGSVAEKVIRKAECPVYVIRHPKRVAA